MINRNILMMNQFPMDGKYFQWLLFIGKYNLCLFVQSFNDESVLNWCILWNNDKYFLSDESHPNGWLILMMNPFQMDGKNLFHFFGQYFERLLFRVYKQVIYSWNPARDHLGGRGSEKISRRTNLLFYFYFDFINCINNFVANLFGLMKCWFAAADTHFTSSKKAKNIFCLMFEVFLDFLFI